MVHILTSFTECFPTSRFRQSPPPKTKTIESICRRSHRGEWMANRFGTFLRSIFQTQAWHYDSWSPNKKRFGGAAFVVTKKNIKIPSSAGVTLIMNPPLRFKLRQPGRLGIQVFNQWVLRLFFFLPWNLGMDGYLDMEPHMIYTYLYRLISDIPNFGSTFDYFERHLCYRLVLLSAFVRNDVTFTWAVTKTLGNLLLELEIVLPS